MKLRDIEVSRETISDIAKGSGNGLSSAHCDIRKTGYTGHDAGILHRNNSKVTLECEWNAIVQGSLDFIILSLWGSSTK